MTTGHSVYRPLVAVLDYGIGNLRSAQKALERVGADARLTNDAALVARAEAVVLPGVGAFKSCMAALRDAGLDKVALEAVDSGKPFLGICVGMQMLYEGSEENPGVAGLGVLPGSVALLPASVKRPQMQWNVLDVRRPSPLLDGIASPAWVYFVHSYAAVPSDDTVATCDYGTTVTAIVERGNVAATQFHPEKSGPTGLRLLANFVRRASTMLHIAPRADWHDARVAGRYAAPSLASEGFIHLSHRFQVLVPADALFRGRRDLVLLEIDPTRLHAGVVLEPGQPVHAGGWFPHLYGPIDLDAVVRVHEFPPGADGSFALPPTLVV